MPAPVPDSATVVGLLVALLVTVSVPVRVPDAVGRKLTLTVQEAPAAIDVPQVLVCGKSPLTETPETVAAAVPVLVTVTAWAALVVLSAWLAKVSEDGLVLRVAEFGVAAAARVDLELRHLTGRPARVGGDVDPDVAGGGRRHGDVHDVGRRR